MFNWLFKKKENSSVVGSPYVMADNVVIETTPAIGQPVLAIIEATKDLGRWEHSNGAFVDLVTYATFYLTYGRGGWKMPLGCWATSEERKTLSSAFASLAENLDKRTQEVERAKMMGLYCKEEE